jgi:hypothetical protein
VAASSLPATAFWSPRKLDRTEIVGRGPGLPGPYSLHAGFESTPALRTRLRDAPRRRTAGELTGSRDRLKTVVTLEKREHDLGEDP